MSTSEFLRSSPTRDDNDNDYDLKKPIISTQTPLHNKISSIPLTKSSTSTSLKNQQQQQQQFTMGTPSITASASKYINQSLNLSGWTPLISKLIPMNNYYYSIQHQTDLYFQTTLIIITTTITTTTIVIATLP